MGRKNKYFTNVEPHLEDIKEWYVEKNEAEIARKLHISISAWEKYKKEHPELQEALNGGKKESAPIFNLTLRIKALGFHYTETKTTVRIKDGVEESRTIETYEKYSPPDVAALNLMLKNCDENWHNDDMTTINLKRQKLEFEKERSEW